MGRALVLWVGLALGAVSSCGGLSDDSSSASGSSSGEAGFAGNPAGGSDAGSDGDGGAGAVGGRDATGGTGGAEVGTGGAEAGTGGAEAGTGGVAGEGPCECSRSGSVIEPEISCTLPLELFCLDDDPFGCRTTLSEAFSLVEGRCNQFMEEYGTRSDCADGTTELYWLEPLRESDHRLVFDENGVLIGRYYWGAAYSDLYTNVCRGSDHEDFLEYQAGVVPTGTCAPACDICAWGDDVCGQGGQGAQAGASAM